MTEQPILDEIRRLRAAVWMVGNMDTDQDKAAWWSTFDAVWKDVAQNHGVQAQADADIMSAGPERITGVALKAPVTGLYMLPAPNRHYDVIMLMVKMGRGHESSRAEHGFVTSHGRYLNRVDALAVALASGQVSEDLRPVPNLPELFSEDVW
jgi:hypothetical protein